MVETLSNSIWQNEEMIYKDTALKYYDAKQDLYLEVNTSNLD